MTKLEDIDLNGLGAFLPDFGGFRVRRYYLPHDWDHIVGDERLFWRVQQDGRGYVQERPPGGLYWLRSGGPESAPPWTVFVVPEDAPARAFSCFRGPLPEDAREPEAPDAYTCTWLPGEAAITVRLEGLSVTTRLGVAASRAAAVMIVRVENTDARARRVTVIPRLAPWLTATQAAAWDMPWLYQTVDYDHAARRVRFGMASPAGRSEQRRALRWLLDQDFERICLNGERFRGRGSERRPAALADADAWQPAADASVYGYPLFAALARTLELAPGASWECRMALGDDGEPEEHLRAVLADVPGELEEAGARKRRAFAAFAVETPDPAFTRYVNEFLALQQQLVLRRGWPSNMRGVRDTAQDYTGVVAWFPEQTRETILEILETERSDGWFLRQYSTDGRRGKHDDRPYVDSGLWVWELVYEYVCQTRDFGLLEETLPFLDSDKPTTVTDHLGRLLAYYMDPDNLGEHGLCKIREGDWNDSANRAGLEGRGESVMVSCHLILCLRQAALLGAATGAAGGALPAAGVCKAFARGLRAAVREHALNAEGFLNGVFADTGHWFFSDRDPDGQSRFNTPVNAFGILAGIFEPDELERLLARIRDIRRPYGYPLFTPALGRPPVDGLGRIGTGDLPPGLGENGTCYNHGCHGFLARALAVAGEGDLFYDVMRCLLPYDQERHPVSQAKTAPYAIVNVYQGAPRHEGEGGDTFFSGTIATAVRNIYQGLLGVQAEPEGLRIRPTFPDAWPEIEGRIVYAGEPLHVVVRRKGAELDIQVNGKPVKDGWCPAPR